MCMSKKDLSLPHVQFASKHRVVDFPTAGLRCAGLDRRETVKLPLSMNVGLLKLLCSQLFGISPTLQALTLHSGPRAGEVISTDSSLDLGYWSLTPGEVIGVVEEASTDVWTRLSGTADFVVPKNWLLPPELRPELQGIVPEAK